MIRPINDNFGTIPEVPLERGLPQGLLKKLKFIDNFITGSGITSGLAGVTYFFYNLNDITEKVANSDHSSYDDLVKKLLITGAVSLAIYGAGHVISYLIGALRWQQLDRQNPEYRNEINHYFDKK